MIDLDAALLDLAECLDHPAGDMLAARIRGQIARPGVGRQRTHPRTRALVAVAAAITVVAAAIVGIGPVRHAVADWLGIGAVDVRVSDTSRPTATGSHPVPGAVTPTTASPAQARTQLASVRARAGFTVAVPSAVAGNLTGAALDTRGRAPLVVLRYPKLTLVEVASVSTSGPVLRKLVDPRAHVDPVTVAGSEGLWISGVQHIGYLDRHGNLEQDSVRGSGPVLLWTHSGVTYRIEGLARLADALAVANSVGTG